jgi:hypothetical protein
VCNGSGLDLSKRTSSQVMVLKNQYRLNRKFEKVLFLILVRELKVHMLISCIIRLFKVCIIGLAHSITYTNQNKNTNSWIQNKISIGKKIPFEFQLVNIGFRGQR